jgi:hypothetical protein
LSGGSFGLLPQAKAFLFFFRPQQYALSGIKLL